MQLARFRWVASILVLVSAVRAQSVVRINQSTTGVQGNYHCFGGIRAISADGRFAVFVSHATNLFPGPDDNGIDGDVLLRDLWNGTTELVSANASGVQGDGVSHQPTISQDGRWAAFSSSATNLVSPDANSSYNDVYLRNLSTGVLERTSLTSTGDQAIGSSFWPTLSADGRFVAFVSDAPLVQGLPLWPQIYLRDREAGTTELVSQTPGALFGNGQNERPSISGDGRFVAFQSRATNLSGAPDVNDDARDVFVRDVLNGTTELVSRSSAGAQGDSESYEPSISADGRFVAFTSAAENLVPGDANGFADIFVRELSGGPTELVSVNDGGEQGNQSSWFPSISADGRFVAFSTRATNFGSGEPGWMQICVRDRLRGTVTVVSRNAGGSPANGDCEAPSISPDGRFVSFAASASNLVTPDANGAITDVFAVDLGAPGFFAHCFGDGTGVPCPCANSGSLGHGCENSSGTGGAQLTASGSSDLSADTLVLTSAGERERAFSIFLQGSEVIDAVVFGDGLRCIGGTLERLYVRQAVGGVATAPLPGDPAVSVRSQAAGSPIAVGSTLHYQTYYRDPAPLFCPSPPGNTWNVSNAISAVWSP